MVAIASGTPYVQHLAVTTTGTPGVGHVFPGRTTRLVISNEGANNVRFYFTLAHYNANTNFIELAATTGYYDQPDEVDAIWLRALVGTSDPVVVKANIRK